MELETRYKGAIELSAIGDALGWMTEFEYSKDIIETKFGQNQINKFHNWEKTVGGRFNGYIDYIAEGSYSDDTQLLLSVARSIQPNGNVDNDYFSKGELPEWLLYSRGAGRTIKNASQKIQRKSARWNDNFFTYRVKDRIIDYTECGANGAAMRILPIALANFKDIDNIKEQVFANSIITHGHPRAILGAILYAYSINAILKENIETFIPEDFISKISLDFKNKFSLPFLSKPEYSNWVLKWNEKSGVLYTDIYNEVLDETNSQLLSLKDAIDKITPSDKVLRELGCIEKSTKGSGIATVLAGIFLACRYHKKPINGIIYAVNYIGSDTDSIAAFTGGLLGALHGEYIIPEDWKKVQDFKYLDAIADKLLSISENSYTLSTTNNALRNNNVRDFILEKDNYKLNDIVNYKTLGIGKIVNIDRQQPLTKAKYNLIIDIDFEIGQTCRFNKLINGEIPQSGNLNQLIELIKERIDVSKQEKIIEKISKLNSENINDLIIEIISLI